MAPSYKYPRLSSPLQLCPILALLLVVLMFTCFPHGVHAEGTFISAPARVDMVYDSSRDIVYITNGSLVLQYQVGTDTYLPSIDLGGNLGGIDLSPDGNTLAVADRLRSETEVWIYLVDLPTGVSRKITFPRALNEGGTFTAAFGNDGTILVTSTFEGTGLVPMRRYDPATGATTQLATVWQNTMLTGSSDAAIVGFAESNSSDGPFGRFRISDGDLLRKSGYTDGTGWYNYEMGVNHDGTQYAIPTYGGTFIYDAELENINAIGQYAGQQPIGVVYHPAEDIVYFAWSGTPEVRAFDTSSYAQLSAYNFEYTFTNTGNQAFTQGRLKTSRDGSLLFATVYGGVRYLRLYDPLTADAQVVVTDQDEPIAIDLSGSVGNGGTLTYAVETNPAHGTLSGTAPHLTYTPNAGYFGPDSFTFEVVYGAADAVAMVDITVNKLNHPPVADDQAVFTNEDNAKGITLSASDIDGDALSYRVMDDPAHGTLSGVAPDLVYTPAADFNGSDSFTFIANDGEMDSDVATVTIVVAAVNDIPVAVDDAIAMLRKTTVNISVLANDWDVDGDSLIVTEVSPSSQGGLVTITADGAGILYTPFRNFIGQDIFTYTVSDGCGGIASATVTVNVLRK